MENGLTCYQAMSHVLLTLLQEPWLDGVSTWTFNSTPPKKLWKHLTLISILTQTRTLKLKDHGM